MLKIRESDFWPNVIPSPMSGVTDRPFRRWLHELAQGRVGVSVTEFISVDSCPVLSPQHIKALRTFEGESPLCVQIFGGEPANMARGAQQIQDLGASFLEINAGCPMPKVIGRGGGSNLLRDIPRFRQVLRHVRRVLQIPMFVKVRIGWDDSQINVLEVLRMVEDEGVEMLSVHGRTRMQGYRGYANWDWIGRVANEARIPIIGNGDIHSAEEAWERLEEYPVSGVGIGRAMMHNPWILGQVADLWEGKPVIQPNGAALWKGISRYLELLGEDGFQTQGAMGRMKQIVARMFRYIEPDTSELRTQLLREVNLELLLKRMEQFLMEDFDKRSCRFVPGRVESLNGGPNTEIECGHQFGR